jgi:acetyl esterase/lipase
MRFLHLFKTGLVFPFAVLSALVVLTPRAHAQSTYSFTVGDISQFVSDSRASGKPLARLVGDKVQQVLDQQGIQLTEEALFWERNIDDITVRSGCTARTVLERLHASATLSADSALAVQLEALSKPIVATLTIYGTVDVSGRLTVKLGSRVLGTCIRYDKESIDAAASADVAMTMSLILNLRPSVTSLANGMQISFSPQVQMKGEVLSITNKNINIKIADFSPLLRALDASVAATHASAILGHGIHEGLIDYVNSWASSQMTLGDANAGLVAWLNSTQNQLNSNLGAKTYFIPNVAVEVAKDLFRFVNRYPLRFPVSYEFLRDNQAEVLKDLYLGDGDALVDLLGTSFACQASASVFRTMPIYPLPAGVTDFQATSMADYCSELAVDSKQKIGNADIWDGSSGSLSEMPWTLTPGTRADVGVLSIANNHQPYMKRVKYKTIPRYRTVIERQECERDASGTRVCRGPTRTLVADIPCKLEMRVYKSDLAANNLHAAIALHGGSWKYRGAAFLGLETQISHLTERGFVVFVPFYRLVGTADGNLECNDASGSDLERDVDDALAWVRTNKTRFGALAENDVFVMGQSAGGLLAGLLAVEHPTEVKRAFLLYPPTDARDMIARYQQTPPIVDSPQALTILEDFIGQSPKTVSLNDAFVAKNSLPARIADSADRSAFFMIHGRSDPLVPSRQSVRLCNALSKSSSSSDFDTGPATNDGGNPAAGSYRKTYSCAGSGKQKSKLHLLAEAEHVLDFCIPQVSCPAGSAQGIASARSSVAEGYNWLAGRPDMNAIMPIINYLLSTP